MFRTFFKFRIHRIAVAHCVHDDQVAAHLPRFVFMYNTNKQTALRCQMPTLHL